MSILWLAQIRNESSAAQTPLKKSDFLLFKKLGFKSIRLPVAFTSFGPKAIARLFTYTTKVAKRCNTYELKLVTDYHYGRLGDNNYLTETPQTIDLWLKLTKRYKNADYSNLFFENYKELPHINPKLWKVAAYNIVTLIRRLINNKP
ncbi:cellulase family glycosylhydrolase [Mucilaginibacter sp. NFR10]|uniref:cellulase family glycosylhydrolase n=1 Tax=Mucilaginibacter sp. NFR10 TaxID=1566292 RepID=UPI00352A39F7